MRSLMKAAPPRIFCPVESLPAIRRMLSAWEALQADTDRATLHGVSPGDEWSLKGDALAKAFRAPHRIAGIGYTIFRRVRKLKPELAGLSQTEIAARANRGDEIQNVIDRPEICFPGDTRIEVVDQEPSVTQARVLLLECTFVGPDVAPRIAHEGGHVHLDDIADRADKFENEVILLTHFSRRHRPQDIRSQVEQRLPEKLRSRVQLLLEP
jgi:ribonuclease Z